MLPKGCEDAVVAGPAADALLSARRRVAELEQALALLARVPAHPHAQPQLRHAPSPYPGSAGSTPRAHGGGPGGAQQGSHARMHLAHPFAGYADPGAQHAPGADPAGMGRRGSGHEGYPGMGMPAGQRAGLRSPLGSEELVFRGAPHMRAMMPGEAGMPAMGARDGAMLHQGSAPLAPRGSAPYSPAHSGDMHGAALRSLGSSGAVSERQGSGPQQRGGAGEQQAALQHQLLGMQGGLLHTLGSGGGGGFDRMESGQDSGGRQQALLEHMLAMQGGPLQTRGSSGGSFERRESGQGSAHVRPDTSAAAAQRALQEHLLARLPPGLLHQQWQQQTGGAAPAAPHSSAQLQGVAPPPGMLHGDAAAVQHAASAASHQGLMHAMAAGASAGPAPSSGKEGMFQNGMQSRSGSGLRPEGQPPQAAGDAEAGRPGMPSSGPDQGPSAPADAPEAVVPAALRVMAMVAAALLEQRPCPEDTLAAVGTLADKLLDALYAAHERVHRTMAAGRALSVEEADGVASSLLALQHEAASVVSGLGMDGCGPSKHAEAVAAAAAQAGREEVVAAVAGFLLSAAAQPGIRAQAASMRRLAAHATGGQAGAREPEDK